MAIVPVFKRGEDRELQAWRDEPLEVSPLFDSFFGRGTLFDSLLFGNFWDPFPLWDYTPSSLYAKDARAAANTHVDWWESSDAHIIEADVPGLTKDDVEILVENGRVLQISGRSKMENGRVLQISGRSKRQGMGTRRRGERSQVGYYRRLKLPANANANAEGLKAEVQNGVLTVTIPKKYPDASSEVRVVEIEEKP